MDKISRKDLLKAGAVSTVAAVGLAGALSPAEAAAGGGGVQIHGTLTIVSGPASGSFPISITVHGPAENLSGSGWDSPPGSAVSLACYYTQAGSVHGHMVSLSGNVLLSNTPAFLGSEVTTEANFATGEITWTFALPAGGPVFVLTGTGVVAHV